MLSQKVIGTTYYISSNGNSSDGTDINAPMSLSIAKNKKYKSGDRILLKSGDVFYEQLSFSVSATEKKPVLVSSYGDGKKPIISVAKIINTNTVWERYTTGIYRVDLTNINNFVGYQGTDDNSCNIGFFTTEDKNIFSSRKSLISII